MILVDLIIFSSAVLGAMFLEALTAIEERREADDINRKAREEIPRTVRTNRTQSQHLYQERCENVCTAGIRTSEAKGLY